MKFWQLTSIFRDDPLALETVLKEQQDWKLYLTWLSEFNSLVDSQNRQILDAVLPESLSERAMHVCKLRFCVQDGILRRSPIELSIERQLTAFDVYMKYGGDAIEDTLERGGWYLPVSQIQK